MGCLMRSEEMALCQLFLQSEAAYICVSELGELGVVQFRDLNPGANAFQRKFVLEVRRCDEMERKLRYIEKEIKKECIPTLDTGDNPDAPASREMAELEATLEKLEAELHEVSTNAETLKKNFLELTELKHVLLKAQHFFEERENAATDEAHRALLEQDAVERQQRTLQIGFVAGVVARERMPAFERMLWRACRGAVYVRQAEISTALHDPVTGEQMSKTVFMVFFQGEQLRIRVKKICEGFRATLYPCPDLPSDRKEMVEGVMTRIEDLNQVLEQTRDHRQRVLVVAAKNLKLWYIKVRKIKAIFHTMNMFNMDVTQKCLIAECWCACSDLEKVQLSLLRGTERSGSTVPSILNRMASSQVPPTLNRTNKFTEVYQAIVDAYGVANYREINPAPFSIITFPFLFSVMFGDLGHGLIAFLCAGYVIFRERQLAPKKGSDSEIWGMFYGGRYLIALMGLFSIYAGIIYNDAFSKSLNVFGSSWRAPATVYDSFRGPWTEQTLSPRFNSSANDNQYLGAPYPLGIDPLWAISHNKITFTNSFKMKLSVILGVSHMMYGVCLSAFNHAHFTNYMNMFCEFIPQVLFLSCTFGYLVLEVIIKWIAFSAQKIEGDLRTDPSCAPSLLIGLINMYLFKYSDAQCRPDAKYYAAQEEVQTFLIIIIAICIPWMLVPKPYLLWRRGYAKKSKRGIASHRRGTNEDDQQNIENGNAVNHDSVLLSTDAANDDIPEHDTQESLGDVIVHQCIHTIEYCLGCVSHTASYLRLWALSLAHGQLSEVLWNMVLRIGLQWGNYAGGPILLVVFVPWAGLTVSVLLLMEGLSAFLHTLRLHWVEFQDKFYSGEGYKFHAFSFDSIINQLGDEDESK